MDTITCSLDRATGSLMETPLGAKHLLNFVTVDIRYIIVIDATIGSGQISMATLI